VSRILVAAPPVDLAGETLAADLIAAARAAGHELIVYAPVVASDPEAQPVKISPPTYAYLDDVGDDRLAGVDFALELFDSGPRGWREEKMGVLHELAALPASVPLLSLCNTCSATEAASYYAHSAQVVGFACVRPFERIKLVELLLPLQVRSTDYRPQGGATTEVGVNPNLQMAVAFFQSLGKETAQVGDCVAGVLPRIVAMLANEATYALQEGVATAEDIDTAMKLGANYPLGPLEWADLIGLDVVHATLWALQAESGDDRYRPCALLTRMVAAGLRGKANRRGFYDYT